jgi:SOS-response transcriptional repressor LexA
VERCSKKKYKEIMSREKTEGTNRVAVNLRWLLKQAEISQNALALATGVKQPTIHKIVTGKNVAPREATLHLLAKHFSISVDDLRFKDFSDQSGLPQHLRGFRIPMISPRIAGVEKIPDRWPDTITIYEPVSNAAFAMKLVDDAMEPKLRADDIVVVDFNAPLQPGQLAAARVKGMDSAIVRQYRALSYTQGRQNFELVPLNNFFPVIKSSDNEIKLLGRIVARWERMP